MPHTDNTTTSPARWWAQCFLQNHREEQPPQGKSQRQSLDWDASQEKKADYRSKSLRFQSVLIDLSHVRRIDEDGLWLSWTLREMCMGGYPTSFVHKPPWFFTALATDSEVHFQTSRIYRQGPAIMKSNVNSQEPLCQPNMLWLALL